MSVNIHLSLHIEKLASPDEADRVESALREVIEEHGIESWVVIGVFHTDPPWVKVSSENGAIIVSGFAQWSTAFERDVETAVRAVAPAAHIDLEWDYPDERL
ncbi:hypothetical protein ABT160_15630 [Streptomyces sp. NPDC001941]|uniref:hypothetical protein n=1 Tax=Streptomyces sp. NPDC001941 TaxID=3154659 RepID=UPI0033266C6F